MVDDTAAKMEGDWTSGTGLKNYVGYGYQYAGAGKGAVATFKLVPRKAGQYNIQIFSQAHPNRSTRTPVSIRRGDFVREYKIDQRSKTKDDIITIDQMKLSPDQEVIVTIGTDGVDGNVHIDAVRLLEAK